MSKDYLLSKYIMEGAIGVKLNGNRLVSCEKVPSTFCIPADTEALEDFCLSGQDNLEFVIITSAVKEIGDGVFANCNNLVRITVPEHLRPYESYLTKNNKAEVRYVSSNKNRK